MDGAWRPAATFGGIALATGAFVASFAPESAAAAFATALFTGGALSWRATRPGARFLAGLRDARVRYHVVTDAVGWWGDRYLQVRTEDGDWHLHTRGGVDATLRVRGPNVARAELRGEWRRAGRIAATVMATPWKTA